MADKDLLLQRTLNKIRSFMAKRTFGTPERGLAVQQFKQQAKPLIQKVIKPIARATIPPYRFYEQGPQIGRQLQKVKIPGAGLAQKFQKFTPGMPALQVPSMIQEQARSYGRTLERSTTPTGRKQLLTSAQRVAKKPFQLSTLQEPAFEAALDLPDILPGGFLMAGLTKKVVGKGIKEVGEKGVKELAEKKLKQAAKARIAPSPTLKGVSPPPQVAKIKATIAGEGRGVLLKAKKEIGEYTPKTKTAKQSLSQFYTDWVNRFHPIEEVATKIEKETGTKILPKLSPKYTTKQLLGAGGTAGLRHKKKLQPTLDMLDNLGIAKDDMDIFLKAKRDIGFGEVGRKIKGSDPIIAQTRINALSQKYNLKQLENIASNLYKYQDEGLQMLRDSGFISSDVYKTIKAQNRYYVPFERVMDSVDNYLGLPTRKAQQATQPIKKIKGSERQIISPIESVIANTYKIEAVVAKNRVANSLVNLRNVAPEYKDLFKPVSKSTNNTISVWQNGKKVFYDVGEDIAKSIKGLNEESMGTITKILAAPARLLRQGATGRNIDFMVPNVFKDQLDAAVSSKYGYKPFIDYFRGLGHLINYKRTGSDEIVEGYLKSGGSIFFESMSGRKAIKEQIADVTVKKGALKTLRDWALGGIETLGEYSETPTRLGLFKRGVEKTSNPLLAAFEAREGTLDFARMGAKMKTANAIIPFLNVGVQGFDKLVRNVKARPGKMALNMAIYAGLPAAMTAIYNNLFHPEELAKIPSWEKENNFIIITGQGKEGRAKYIKLPKGNIVPFIANPTEHFIAWAAGNDPQSFTQMAMSLFSEGLPILKGGQTPKEIASRTAGGLLPQAFKPGIEQLANYSFFKGKEIVPSYLKARPTWEQTTKYTERTYNKLGDVFNASPLKIKNMLEGYFSGYVKVPTHIIETVMNMAEGKRVEKNKIPIVRRFIGESLPAKTLTQMKGREETKKLKTKELKAKRPGLLQRIIKPGVESGAVEEALPVTEKGLTTLYKDNASVLDKYEDKKTKIKYGDYTEWEKESKLIDLQEDFDFANNQQDLIRKQNPQLADDYDYYNIAKKTNAEKTDYVLEELTNLAGQTNNRGDLLKWLAMQRKEIDNKKILADGVIDNLYDQGLISYSERKQLKALKFDKDGKLKLKVSGRGSGAKIKKISVTPVKPTKAKFIKATTVKAKPSFKIRKEDIEKIKL